MAQRIARLRLDSTRVGVGDADEDLVGPLSRADEILEVSVVEGLEAPVDHPRAAQTTRTPDPSSTRPTRRRNSLRAMNSASSAGPFSAGSETSNPPAVCGS